jgi:hypothetical protein
MARHRRRVEDRSASEPVRRTGLRWTGWGLVAATLLVVASRGPFPIGASPSPARDGRLPVIRLSAEEGRLPVDSAALAMAAASLPSGFVRHESARFIALSDGSAAWVRSQLERFERAHHQFERCLRRLGLSPPPLRHKLVAVLFAEHRAFVEFAARVDGVTGGWVHAYYLPREDRVVAFDSESGPAEGAASEAAPLRLGGRSLASDLGRSVAGTPSPRSTATAAMVHEAIHQLMFHVGLHRPGATPFWLGEGLAVAFETDRPSAAFGPDLDHPPRRAEFERLLESGRLISLASFVEFERPPDDHPETIRLFYHQAGAIVAYLFRERPAELRRHLEALAASPADPGPPRRGRFLQAFRESFGDPLAVEQAWLEWERDRLRRGPPTRR